MNNNNNNNINLYGTIKLSKFQINVYNTLHTLNYFIINNKIIVG